MKRSKDPLTLRTLQQRFDSEENALAWLEQVRWPEGPVCPACGSINRASRITTRPGQFTCLECKRRFSVTAGTPMHKTHLPLATWIIAAYLIATSSKGLSSLKLSQILGLQYRTTWHLAHRIRAMMDDMPDLMRGIVELDETYMGGRPRKGNEPASPAPIPLFEEPAPPPPPKKSKKRTKVGRGTGKPMAFTMVERGGKARLIPVLSHGTADFWPLVSDQVHLSAVIATDDLPAYISIGRLYAGHIKVNHSSGEFARDDERTGLRAHVNSAESIHSIFKRAVIGVWHWISGKHMCRYLREIEFRWNHRTFFEDRIATMFGSAAGPLPLKGLFA
ncbi:IS1595 family transposase [Candidatus Methylocalor cossyra]|uniref:Transposase n=1 Tax=Candidatus Methylocalor cossyra TaxID=3108543 RepID=A0ABP1CCU2_9GAMM